MPYFCYKNKKIFYRDEGEGQTILLLPGNTSSSSIHDAEIEFFSKNYRVICPDYPGYGKSDRVERFPVDFWWYNAEMCVQLIRFLEVDDFIVIGTSGGGMVALNVAIMSRGSVKCAIADSIPGEFPSENDIELLMIGRENMTKGQILFWTRAHGQDWRDVVELDTMLVLDNAKRGESFYKGRLGEIKCPVLLTGSLADDMVVNIEVGIANIARQISMSKIVLFPAGWHTLMLSRPEAFRAEVTGFIEKIDL
jgi:pimeloyl-ACP methyl ester carboxylesterase